MAIAAGVLGLGLMLAAVPEARGRSLAGSNGGEIRVGAQDAAKQEAEKKEAEAKAQTSGAQKSEAEKKEAEKKAGTAVTVGMAHPANPEDVKSLDAIVSAIYGVISGPPGARDWKRFESLFAKDARLIAVHVPKDGGKAELRTMTPAGYAEMAGSYFLAHGFFENEISRKTDSFGDMTHIYTTYESRETKDAKPFARGINSMEFFNDGQRWWCVEIYWDEERPGNAIPEKYLGK
jgi:hypothetical protein